LYLCFFIDLKRFIFFYKIDFVIFKNIYCCFFLSIKQKTNSMRNSYTLCIATICLALLFISGLSRTNAQNALHFDGTDDFVQVASASNQIANATGISLSVWVYPTNTASAWPDFDGFGGFRNDVNSDFYICQLSSSGIEARFRNSSGTAFDLTSSTLVLNTWQHFVLTYNGSLLSLYRNGVLLNSVAASGTITNTAVPLYIGKLVYSANNFSYQGSIDEFSLWSKGLTASEVSSLYYGVINTSDVALKLYYKFDQGVANGNNAGITTLTDTKGNINGILNNFALNGTTSNWVGGVILNIPTDAGISGVNHPGDTVCAGSQPVKVILKNFGPNPLATVKIDWKINTLQQSQVNWNGNLPVNGTDTVTLGSYPFHHDTLYTVKAWSSMPNAVADTAPLNDTVVKSGIFIKAAPGLTPGATTYNICQGDTAYLTGILTGTPPWTIVVSTGTGSQTIPGIINSNLILPVTPSTTTTYTILSISDGGGCPNTTPIPITVTVNPAPPALVTATGNTTFCSGDSVVLQATVGLNFTYTWYKDGIVIPDGINFTYAAKQPGSYTVRVTSPIGCAAVSAPVLVTVHPAPPVSLGNDTAVAASASLSLNAGAGYTSYLWSTGANTQMINVDSSGTGLGTKTVWARVTDNLGCKGADTIRISFVNNPGIASIPGYQTPLIFPNPSSGVLSITFPDPLFENLMIEVFSVAGRVVLQQEWVTLGMDTTVIDISGLTGGVYRLHLRSDGQMVHQSTIILVK
jgi:hypothetical protein